MSLFCETDIGGYKGGNPYTVVASKPSLPCFVPVRQHAREAAAALEAVRLHRYAPIIGVIAGFHSDAWADDLGITNPSRTEDVARAGYVKLVAAGEADEVVATAASALDG